MTSDSPKGSSILALLLPPGELAVPETRGSQEDGRLQMSVRDQSLVWQGHSKKCEVIHLSG